MPNDPIGDRMKSQYEVRTRYLLPRRTYTILRIDGKAFHTYTRGRLKPFDVMLSDAMDSAAVELCGEAMGVRLAYGQSDEYSFLLTDFETTGSQAWFDGQIQKMCSIAASAFTATFNRSDTTSGRVAYFDCRAFTIPDAIEVENYFIWRQQDAVRNSILSLGQAHFSANQMHGVDCGKLQNMLFTERGINWNDLRAADKRGRCVVKENYEVAGAQRSRWAVDAETPTFTADREYLRQRIPRIE